MNTPLMSNRTHAVAVKPLIVALMLSGSATGLAANMRDIVSTHSYQPAVQTYGRDSVYAVTTSDKRMQVARSASGKSYNATSAAKTPRYPRAEPHHIVSNEVVVRPKGAVVVSVSRRIGVAGMGEQVAVEISARDVPVAAYTVGDSSDESNLRPAAPYRREDVDATVSPTTEDADKQSKTDMAAQSEVNREQQSDTELHADSNPSEVETPLELDKKHTKPRMTTAIYRPQC
jgi:hypothetical protein